VDRSFDETEKAPSQKVIMPIFRLTERLSQSCRRIQT